MGEVDQSDQLVMYYGYVHRQTKWWKRVSLVNFHLVDLSLVNASILYNCVNEKKTHPNGVSNRSCKRVIERIQQACLWRKGSACLWCIGYAGIMMCLSCQAGCNMCGYCFVFPLSE